MLLRIATPIHCAANSHLNLSSRPANYFNGLLAVNSEQQGFTDG
jgi:hypothetical protein